MKHATNSRLSNLLWALLLVAGCAEMQAPAPQRVATPNERAVQRWLEEWEKAWNLHDTRKLQVMSNLNTAEMLEIQRIFDDHVGLEVSIDNVRVHEASGGVVQATYTRHDGWHGAATGKVGSASGSYLHSFRVSGGVARPYAIKRQ